MTKKERIEIIKQRINTIKLNTKIGSRRIADEENAVLLDNIEYNLNKLSELLARLEEENERLKAQNYIYYLENIQLKQDISLILNNQEQSTVLFNYIAEVYEELDSLMARLQDDYNNGIEFEQKEEDRLIIGNILDIFEEYLDLEEEKRSK